VTTFVGSHENGNAVGIGQGVAFGLAYDVTLNPAGSLYVTDYSSASVKAIDIASARVSYVAGSTYDGVVPGQIPNGCADGVGSNAGFYYPKGAAFDTSSGILYVADAQYSLIRSINLTTYNVSTIAGGGSRTWSGVAGATCVGYIGSTGTARPNFLGLADGVGTAALFRLSYFGAIYHVGMAADNAGRLFVADSANNVIRTIALSTGTVTTLAGGGVSLGTTAGSTNGFGSAATFNTPVGLALDGAGALYVTDYGSNLIRAIVIATGAVTTLAGGSGVGTANGAGTSASFTNPTGITYDGAGTLYVTDGFSLIRAVATGAYGSVAPGTVAAVAGTAISPCSGTGTSSSYANGDAAAARFCTPLGLVAAGASTLYVADSSNYVVRAVAAAWAFSGTPSASPSGSPSSSRQIFQAL